MRNAQDVRVEALWRRANQAIDAHPECAAMLPVLRGLRDELRLARDENQALRDELTEVYTLRGAESASGRREATE